MAFRPEMAFWQKLLFSRKCFLAKNTFAKFEVAFWPEMTFWLEMSFCQIWLKRLTSQSIERFCSPLMSESFQDCFFLLFYSSRQKKPNSFVRFLGESTARKSAYGFIWPLSNNDVGLKIKPIWSFWQWQVSGCYIIDGPQGAGYNFDTV